MERPTWAIIKEVGNRSLVETRPRSTVRVEIEKANEEHLTYHEIAEITRSEVLADRLDEIRNQ